MDSPRAVQDRAALHRLIHQKPNLLPQAGPLRLMVLGSEVQLGSGNADILAVEPYGQPTFIEVKLASNGEARRARSFAARGTEGAQVLQVGTAALAAGAEDGVGVLGSDALHTQGRTGDISAGFLGST